MEDELSNIKILNRYMIVFNVSIQDLDRDLVWGRNIPTNWWKGSKKQVNEEKNMTL